MSKLLVDKVGLDGRNKLSNFLEVPGANPANIRFKILNTQTRHVQYTSTQEAGYFKVININEPKNNDDIMNNETPLCGSREASMGFVENHQLQKVKNMNFHLNF